MGQNIKTQNTVKTTSIMRITPMEDQTKNGRSIVMVFIYID